MKMLTRNQKIDIVRAVCRASENRCTDKCFLRQPLDDIARCMDFDVRTDAEIDRALWEIFRRCGITYQPEKREHRVLVRSLYNDTDARAFNTDLTEATAQGYKIENCGVNGAGPVVAWAIVGRPVKED